MPQIKSLRVSNGARNGQLPARLKILDWGRNETLKGIFVVDELTAQCFDANQKKVGRDRVCLDFEHNTVPGSEEFGRTKEPRDVAGYWTPKVIPGEGIFLEAPEWTPIGKEKALNFEDISAAPFVDGDRVIGLHSVALTRAGASDFTFFSAENEGIAATLKTLSAGHREHREHREIMNENITVSELAVALGLKADAKKEDVVAKLSAPPGVPANVIVLADIAPALGLASDAKKEDVLGKLKTLSTGKATEGTETAEKKNSDAPLQLSAVIDGKTVTLSGADLVTSIVALRSENESLKKAATEGERLKLVQRFAAEGKAPKGADGKTLSQEQLGALDVATLQMLHANTPVTVPLSARNRATAPEGKELTGWNRSLAATRRQLAEANGN